MKASGLVYYIFNLSCRGIIPLDQMASVILPFENGYKPHLFSKSLLYQLKKVLWTKNTPECDTDFLCVIIEIRPSFSNIEFSLWLLHIDRPQCACLSFKIHCKWSKLSNPSLPDDSAHLCFQGGRCLGVGFLACRNYHFIFNAAPPKLL